MQCQECSEPGVVQMTEVQRGKPIIQNFCKQHASERKIAFVYKKNVNPREWENFFVWIASFIQQNGQLPSAAEIERHAGFWERDTETGFPQLVAILRYRFARGGVAAIDRIAMRAFARNGAYMSIREKAA